MEKIKGLFIKMRRLSKGTKLKLVLALVLTVCFGASAKAYAWFNMQKKAAEMFKVQYPNSLYINAAHREDRVFFELGAIDVGAYEKDEYGNTIYYAKNSVDDTPLYARDDEDQVINDEYGHPVYDIDNGDPHKIRYRQYAFSVSGTGMDSFILQLAHTNNNKFTYKIYEAAQYTSSSAAIAAVTQTVHDEETDETVTVIDTDRVVKYTSNPASHNENKLQVAHDQFNDSAPAADYYYVRNINPIALNGYKNVNASGVATRNVNNKYYKETYGSYSTDKVHEDAMPSYWQAAINLSDREIDPNKGFSKYFILEVTWDEEEQKTQEKKETDMIYISAKRN